MSTIFVPQLTFDQNSTEKQLQNELNNFDMPISSPTYGRQNQQHQRDDYQLSERDFTNQNHHQHHQRENNRTQHQLKSHEREQHLKELSSLSNLLLDIPSSPNTCASTYNAAPGSKYQTMREHSMKAKSDSSASLDTSEMSISDMFGLGAPQRASMNNITKEQGGQSSYDSSSYRHFNYNQQKDPINNELYPSTLSTEHCDSSGYYSGSYSSSINDINSGNNNSLETPSSPSSVNTPITPGTPSSVYSNNPYQYSSYNNSPYNSTWSLSSRYTNKRNLQSPVRSPPCQGRPIRGSPPYSDCSSPSVEYPSHTFRCNGSRSGSPADSDVSVNSLDGPLNDIMNCLPLNMQQQQQHQCQNVQNILGQLEKSFASGHISIEDYHRLKKLIQTHYQHQQQQQQLQQMQLQSQAQHHYHHNHNVVHSRNHFSHQQQQQNNIPHTGSCCEKNLYVSNNRNVPISPVPNNPSLPFLSLDRATRIHRKAATASQSHVSHTWCGELPKKTQKPVGYSAKVFAGGTPWDATTATFEAAFKQFGPVSVEWPGKDATNQPKGYAYVKFESEKQVKALLNCCTHDFTNGGRYYYKISSKRMKGKEVQIIPWALNDSNYVKSSSQKLDPAKTVFVGALHGMMTAAGLAKIMDDLFQNVIYAGIDTDKFRYPIGSARITFSTKESFTKAVNAAFIDVKTPEFEKVIQIDPYIGDSPCSSCYVQQGPYFCRDPICFKYYCHTCWQWAHSSDYMSGHKAMSRVLKKNQVIGLSSNADPSH